MVPSPSLSAIAQCLMVEPVTETGELYPLGAHERAARSGDELLPILGVGSSGQRNTRTKPFS